MDEESLQIKLTNKYNNWGERQPLVCADKTKISKATKVFHRQDLSIAEKSALYINCLTDICGFEFVSFSNACLERSVLLPNSVTLFPCFYASFEGIDNNDRKLQLSLKMKQQGNYVYDGWMPITNFSDSSIRTSLRLLNEALSIFSIVSGSKFSWEPKYSIGGIPESTHYLGVPHIQTIEELTNHLTDINEADRSAIFRSISWLDQSNKVTDSKAKFLFRVLAIESLSTYIENDANDDSPLVSVRTGNLSKSEKKLQRENCINTIIQDQLSNNPTKAILEFLLC